MSYGVKLRVSGPFACWTRPELKAERVSYDVPTPSAIRGILEAVHWKPAICWHVSRIHVLKPIRFTSIRRNEVASKIPVTTARRAMKTGSLAELGLTIEKDRQQRAATVLVDVDYVVEAAFTLTPKAGPDDTPGKHLDIFNRRVRKGQCFHQPCLGTREFDARIDVLDPDAPPPPPIPETRDLGYMLYDIDHANDRGALFFRARMDSGIVTVPAPDSPEIRR
ncbi:type I-C CRISPR-associated protein Cas5 [Roseospira marina]|uniref:pre-crRNA processing endonuclease n=1 Tax=Roseospira marina TaxID=140057 RepID=A0A5M6IG43_9PROT|nr:type I-C CRISPR-associated protein Cas5c [Roseospira marina]KAA5606847.1 type I-C CRISPR-associated protein Cas5 [Roseospira marina]MBB4312988.1 CRISPR-associated protein Cas5d [Roseospira marina]MBB5086238.1 CRISPR-associated protein Cas5d [Roseospira marina]